MRSEKCKIGPEEKTKRIERLEEINNKGGIDGLIKFFKKNGEKYKEKFINFVFDCTAVSGENKKSWLFLENFF